MQEKRDFAPLTGALFVLLTLIAFIPLGGDTPEGDDPAQKVVSFYSNHESKEIFAAVVLCLGAVALLFFAASLRARLEAEKPGPGILPTVALGAGIIASGGFFTAAALHFALADYAGDVGPAATQAMNAIDVDFFLPFVFGVTTLILATSIWLIRSRALLPAWLGWVGIIIFIAGCTPAGFIAFGLAGLWILVVSVMLYLRQGSAPVAASAGG